ncbi:MAG: hypothetical protein AB7O52_04950 [Planctomycetota bacterium]
MTAERMVTAWRPNAIRRLRVALWAAVFLVGGSWIRADERRAASRIELGDSAASQALASVPAAERGEAWLYLSALAALLQGDPTSATQFATRAETQFASPRAWLIREFLELHFDLAATLRRHGRLGAPEGLRSGALGENPSLAAARRWVEWSAANLDRELVPFERIAHVDHFGAWPSVLPAAKGRPAEPASEGERLAWLRSQLPLVLERLAGVTPDRLFGAGRASGRWLLLVTLRAGANLAQVQAACEAIWRQVASEELVVVWLLEVDPGDRSAEWRSELREVRMPLFVITTRDATNFGRPGFERGGVSLLLDPDLFVRASVPPGLPLPTLGHVVREWLRGSD